MAEKIYRSKSSHARILSKIKLKTRKLKIYFFRIETANRTVFSKTRITFDLKDRSILNFKNRKANSIIYLVLKFENQPSGLSLLTYMHNYESLNSSLHLTLKPPKTPKHICWLDKWLKTKIRNWQKNTVYQKSICLV